MFFPVEPAGCYRQASAIQWALAAPQCCPHLISLPAVGRYLSASNSEYERALGRLVCVGLNLRQPLEDPGIKVDGALSAEVVKCTILLMG